MNGDDKNIPPEANGSSQSPEGRGEGIDIHLSPEMVQSLLQQLAPDVMELQRRLDKAKEQNLYAMQMLVEERKKNDKLEAENRRLRQQLEAMNTGGDSVAVPPFEYFIDTRLFADITEPTFIQLWDLIFTFTKPTEGVCGGKPLISNASAIAPLYILLSDENSPHRFTGKRKDFAYMWNKNVMTRVDKFMQPGLTCKEDSLTATLNREPWKNVSPSSWGKLSLEGSRYGERYGMAKAMKDRLQDFYK